MRLLNWRGFARTHRDALLRSPVFYAFVVFTTVLCCLCAVWLRWEWRHERNGQLATAASSGDTSAVRTLLDSGIDPNAQNARSLSALERAAFAGHTSTVHLLLDRGAQFGASLRCAAAEGHTDIIALLADRGAHVSGPEGVSALCQAASRDHLDAVKLLLRRGADVNARDDYGMTAIQSAIQSDAGEIVRFLMSQGADLSKRTSYGQTLLMLAAESGDASLCQELIRRGAPVDAGAPDGKTALICAVDFARSGDPAEYDNKKALATVDVLLASGADVNARDRYHNSAFRYAAEYGNAAIKKRLKKAGAHY